MQCKAVSNNDASDSWNDSGIEGKGLLKGELWGGLCRIQRHTRMCWQAGPRVWPRSRGRGTKRMLTKATQVKRAGGRPGEQVRRWSEREKTAGALAEGGAGRTWMQVTGFGLRWMRIREPVSKGRVKSERILRKSSLETAALQEAFRYLF